MNSSDTTAAAIDFFNDLFSKNIFTPAPGDLADMAGIIAATRRQQTRSSSTDYTGPTMRRTKNAAAGMKLSICRCLIEPVK